MPLPPRRWLQFRLSTWFVLIAILAWALACVPAIDCQKQSAIVGYPNARGGAMVGFGFASTTKETWWMVTIEPSTLLWPALALAAFVGWKAAWAIGRRVKRRKGE